MLHDIHYSVKQLSQLAGVSVRTLHYYDEIKLLNPSMVKKNGYRFYGHKELVRLQHILFFRELDFSLTEIKNIVDRPQDQIIQALQDQLQVFKLKQKRGESLIKTINATINRMTTKQKINDPIRYDAFDDEEVKRHEAEVKARWGNTKAYEQSQARLRQMTKEDVERLKADGLALTAAIAREMPKGVKSDEVQALIKKHHQGIERFYDCDLFMYRTLADMYVEDSRFMAYYENVSPGLAEFMHQAMYYYCDQQKNILKN